MFIYGCLGVLHPLHRFGGQTQICGFLAFGSSTGPIYGLHGGAQRIERGCNQFVDFLLRNDFFRDQSTRPLLTQCRMLLELAVSYRLRESRLIVLVVTVTTVADQIDDELFAELQPVRNRHLGDEGACFKVIRVDMNDRDLVSACDVGAVLSRISFVRFGRESQLVVGDHVDCATNRISFEVHQVQGFCDNALACKCSVAVDEQCHRFEMRIGTVSCFVLRGSDRAQHNRVDHLQMAGVRKQTQHDVG